MQKPNFGAVSIAQNLLKMLISYSCELCYDSTIKIEHGQPVFCECGAQANDAIIKLTAKITERKDAGKFINQQVIETACCLVLTTPETPVSLTALMQELNTTERPIKGFIESLRKEWRLPIGSSRNHPTGYYWISTPEQMKHWLNEFLAQPKQEFQTAYRVVNANFPELAGQFNFDFTEGEN